MREWKKAILLSIASGSASFVGYGSSQLQPKGVPLGEQITKNDPQPLNKL